MLMMYYRRGLLVTMVQGDLEFKPLEELVKELPSVPELDIAAKESMLATLDAKFASSRNSLGDDPTWIHTLRKYVGQGEDKTRVETAIAKQ